MKPKLWISLILLAIIIACLIFSRIIAIQEILLLYGLILIPSIVFVTIEFFAVKKKTFQDFLERKIFGHLLTLIFCFGFFLYSLSGKPVSKKTAIEDLDFMIESLENIHPDIYQEIPKDSFQQHFEKIKDNLPIFLTNTDFYECCARLCSYFRTAHTKPMANTIEKGIQKFFRNNFPFEIRIIENRMYIIESYTWRDKVPLGSEIIEINNKKVSQLIDEWSQLASYESDAYRNFQITNRAHIGIWNNFRRFKITYKDYDTGELKRKRVSGGFLSNWTMGMKRSSKKRPTLLYKEISPGIGYIGFFSFHDLETYKDFFVSTFEEIQNNKINNLIIDIRGNQGGHTIIGRELMQYVFNQPFLEQDSSTRKISKELIATGKVEKKIGPKERIPGELITTVFNPIQLKENPFRYYGKTYLLTDNATFSAGQGLASAYKCYGNGTIIGEETGGVTVNFADVHFFNLPNTNQQIMTSWEKAYFPCGVDNNRGVQPDYKVTKSIQDYIDKNDRVLDFTINLINNEQRKN